MGKIKKVWQENKVLLVLAIVLVICVAVLVVVSITYFYGTSDSVYGSRLDITEKVPMTNETLTKVKEKLEENDKVDSTRVTVKGRIVYISIKFIDDVKMADAKKIAESSLELFSEDELSVYDLQYTIASIITKEDKNNKTYTLMGSRNVNGTGTIVWNNYNIEETEK